jgi:hypothetical protein
MPAKAVHVRKKQNRLRALNHAKRRKDQPAAPPIISPHEDGISPLEKERRQAMVRLSAVFELDNLPVRGREEEKLWKRYYLKCYAQSICILTTACAHAGISKVTVTKWRNEDQVFAKAMDELQDVALDLVEGKLMQAINNGDIRAIMFYLRTKGRSRGYVEQQRMPYFNEDDGRDVFAGMNAQNTLMTPGANGGEQFIALSELQREIPPESLKEAKRILKEMEADAKIVSSKPA